MKSPVTIFIPGILQDPAGVDDWAKHACWWVDRETEGKADRYEYTSGALTRFAGQAARVKDCSTIVRQYGDRPINIVGHSNGCEIACRMLRECSDLKVSSLHLLAAAADADFDKNGLNKAAAEQRVRAIYVYASRSDMVLRRGGGISRFLFSWVGLGYGTLGYTGPQNVKYPATALLKTEWRNSYGHSTWIDDEHAEETMRLVTR